MQSADDCLASANVAEQRVENRIVLRRRCARYGPEVTSSIANARRSCEVKHEQWPPVCLRHFEKDAPRGFLLAGFQRDKTLHGSTAARFVEAEHACGLIGGKAGGVPSPRQDVRIKRHRFINRISCALTSHISAIKSED